MKVGVLTVSDGCARGVRKDASGDAIVGWCAASGLTVAVRDVVPDDTARITRTLAAWCDDLDVDVVLTTGGTGPAPRDVTPEATRAVLEREMPGVAEALRRKGERTTPYALLSRGVAGIRGHTLVVNLPGSPGGVRDGL